jgi:hypothetical protein
MIASNYLLELNFLSALINLFAYCVVRADIMCYDPVAVCQDVVGHGRCRVPSMRPLTRAPSSLPWLSSDSQQSCH